MNLFPIFAQLTHKPVFVAGGGAVAERKVSLLVSAGAQVTVGAPTLTPALHERVRQGDIQWREGEFSPTWLEQAWLVIAATDDTALNARIAQLADTLRIWVNVVDDPAHSSFHVPAIVDRSPVTIAISSGGHAPMLARRIRERLETLIDHSIGSLGTLTARYRQAIRRAYPQLGPRRRFYDWLVDGPVHTALRNQNTDQAATLIETALHQTAPSTDGKVVLVGAGPGDPGLLTIKALRALNQADVILYDRLVSADILEMARRDADRIFVGKTPGEDHHATQARIHDLMVEHAQAGKYVVRLKGGDAFIFGRGGEELAHLAQHGVAYEVIPGITAAVAAAAYAGIPLTHRHVSQSLHLLTAHSAREGDQPDWAALVRSGQTLGFYMGVGQLAQVANKLMAHGMPADTPFALIEKASLPQQRTLTGPLADLSALATQHAIQAPALLLVGEVTRLAADLHWYGSHLNHLHTALSTETQQAA